MLDDNAVQAHRKARLRELIDNATDGLIARLAERIGRSESYVGRMLYPPGKPYARPVSDKLARIVEREFALCRGWFDLPLGTDLPYPPLGASAAYVAPPAGVPHAADSRIHADTAAIVWPFHRASYRRVRELMAALGKRAPEALRDMDAHLDILLTKWEQELARTAAANRPAAA